jgi:hypothetical protein
LEQRGLYQTTTSSLAMALRYRPWGEGWAG